MKHLRILFSRLFFAVFLVCVDHEFGFARGTEGERKNSILLNGSWEYTVGDGTEQAESILGQKPLTWKRLELPGAIEGVSPETKILWVRRTFFVTGEQAKLMPVLRWNRISSGAEAFINGKKVGENEPTGPYQVLIPSGVIRANENQIVLKIRGAAGVRRSKSGNPMFPCGFGVGPPEITDDIWIDFANDVYMKWVLAIPELENGGVKIRVTPVGFKKRDNIQITAIVELCGVGMKTAGYEMFGHGKARLIPDSDPLGGEHFFVDVNMPNLEKWDFERQPLYSATVKIFDERETFDEVTFRFAMREIGVKDKRYQLNGRNLQLRGSNLVFEWNWGDTITGKELDYFVTESREMSMNSFRTHTQPTNRKCSDICDEYGTMILAEFPVLYNYQDYKFTPEEYEIWHRNVLTDSAGWMARLWNHPSVIMWVLSNESQGDNKWEETVFQDFVNKLDPTRPTMRTGTTGTKENLDLHLCGNITDTAEGLLIAHKPYWFNEQGNRTLTISEYMNYFGHPYTQWIGIDDSLANDVAVAQIGAEHTEAMRRERVDGIFPYMYAGWTRTRQSARVRQQGTGNTVWKANYASPLSAVWHSTLSPVLASIDLFDANYLTGQEVETVLFLINDSWKDANVHIDLMLTKDNPQWIPEAECFNNFVSRWSYDFTLGTDSLKKTTVKWKLPEEPGNYWLTARLTGIKGSPVLSQRFVRAIAAPVASDVLRTKTFAMLGGNETAGEFFRSMKLTTVPLLKAVNLDTKKHVLVIWNAGQLTEREKRYAKQLCDFAEQGGHILVLAASSWDWTELCDVKISGEPRFSRVFVKSNRNENKTPKFDSQYLFRWNGLPGTVAAGQLEGNVMKRAEKILWAKEPNTVVAAFVPAKTDKGKILFSQLDFQEHIVPGTKKYDLAAVHILLKMLEN